VPGYLVKINLQISKFSLKIYSIIDHFLEVFCIFCSIKGLDQRIDMQVDKKIIIIFPKNIDFWRFSMKIYREIQSFTVTPFFQKLPGI